MDINWQFNEMRHAGTDYDLPENIESYDEVMKQFRDIPREIELMLEQTGVQSGAQKEETIVEFGCGTGLFTLPLAKAAKQVIAFDISEGMLGFTRKRFEQAGQTNGKFVLGGFVDQKGETPQAGSVAAVVSQYALHHLSDFWKKRALDNIYHMLKPGGIFFLRDIVFPGRARNNGETLDGETLDGDPERRDIDEMLQRVKEGAGEAFAKEYALHISDEFSTYDWILEGLFERAGFSTIYREGQDDYVTVYTLQKPLKFKAL